MLKKVVIAGLAVAVGVAVLAWISPPLFEYILYTGKHATDSMEDAVPLEQRIDILKDKLKDIENNKAKYYDQAAKEAVEVDKLTAQVDKMSADIKTQWDKIDALRDQLSDTQKTSFKFNGQSYSRTEVEKDLKQKFDAVKTAEGSLDASKDLLSARKQALQAARDQLASMESQNSEMEARLEEMKAKVVQLRLREAQAGAKTADNELANFKAEVDALDGKVAERGKALDLKAEFGKGPIDPATDKALEVNIEWVI